MELKNKEEMRKFYEENMYGIWREGEAVTYELLGEDPKAKEKNEGFRNPFEVIGGELVKIKIKANDNKADFIVHAYLPKEENRKKYPKGSPFIICLHPIQPKDYILEQGYALFFLEGNKIASDNTEHKGAFYDIYPYGKDPEDQTGVLMAWAWGASKVLDAVIGGLYKEFNLDPEASMVTGVSRCGKATAVCGAFDERFKVTIPACSGAGGLALYNFFSEGKIYDLRKVGGPAEYTYGKNEPLSCLQSDAERGWFNDKFLEYKDPSDIPADQEMLPVMAMDKGRFYFIIAACTGEDWVNAPSMWECYKKADKIYTREGLADHLVLNFHKVGHVVLQEDMEKLIPYFNYMYYGFEPKPDINSLKTTVFAGQEEGNAPVLRLRPYKSGDSSFFAEWIKDEEVFQKWGGELFGSFPISAETIDKKYKEQNGGCEEPDNFYPYTAFDESGVVGQFIIRYINKEHNIVRFGWVLVDDSKRGLGYGKRMLEMGKEIAFNILKAKKITIGVYENNIPAYNCYKSLGFTEAAEQPGKTAIIKGTECKVIELELLKQ